MKTGASKEWWEAFLKRIGFPEYGHFMIVPDKAPNEVLLMHGESMQSVGVTLDLGESLEDCAAFFRTVLPNGEVAAPAECAEKLTNGGG